MKNNLFIIVAILALLISGANAQDALPGDGYPKESVVSNKSQVLDILIRDYGYSANNAQNVVTSINYLIWDLFNRLNEANVTIGQESKSKLFYEIIYRCFVSNLTPVQVSSVNHSKITTYTAWEYLWHLKQNAIFKYSRIVFLYPKNNLGENNLSIVVEQQYEGNQYSDITKKIFQIDVKIYPAGRVESRISGIKVMSTTRPY